MFLENVKIWHYYFGNLFYFSITKSMKKANYLRILLVIIVAAITFTSCSSERKASGGKGCGCAARKGFVGY
jgi:hypothetical protein